MQLAQEESDKPAEISFLNALVVAEIHHDLYIKALEAVESGRDLPDRKVYVCKICVNTVWSRRFHSETPGYQPKPDRGLNARCKVPTC